MTPAALKAEIQTGPHAAALAAFVTAANDTAIAAFLNDPNGAGKGTVNITAQDKQRLLKSLVPVALVLAGKNAVSVNTSGATTVSASTFTLSVPTNDLTTGLIRLS